MDLDKVGQEDLEVLVDQEDLEAEAVEMMMDQVDQGDLVDLVDKGTMGGC